MKTTYVQSPFHFKTGRRAFVLEIIAQLYEIPRTGWVDRKVINPETVGEHTDALIALARKYYPFMPELIPMLKIHDWAETNKKIGDARTDRYCPPDHRWTKEKKHEVELATMKEICSHLGVAGKRLLKLWLEYDENITNRAKIAHQLGRLQRVLKAVNYQRLGQPVIAQEFIECDEAEIFDPVLVKVLERAKLRLAKPCLQS